MCMIPRRVRFPLFKRQGGVWYTRAVTFNIKSALTALGRWTCFGVWKWRTWSFCAAFSIIICKTTAVSHVACWCDWHRADWTRYRGPLQWTFGLISTTSDSEIRSLRLPGNHVSGLSLDCHCPKVKFVELVVDRVYVCSRAKVRAIVEAEAAKQIN